MTTMMTSTNAAASMETPKSKPMEEKRREEKPRTHVTQLEETPKSKPMEEKRREEKPRTHVTQLEETPKSKPMEEKRKEEKPSTDVTQLEEPAQVAFHLKPGGVTRMREVTGTQPMDTAWEQLWRESETPWDAQGVTPAISYLLRHNQIRDQAKVLVPGCGTGYDVVALATPTRHVTGLDISMTALEQARQHAANSPNAYFVVADFFSTFAPPCSSKFDVVFDYTFFCAIDPSLRRRWAERMAELLALDGELITLMFPLDVHVGGPPFTVSLEAYEEVLHPLGFKLTSCVAEIPSVPGRQGLEKLGRWERSIAEVSLQAA